MGDKKGWQSLSNLFDAKAGSGAPVKKAPAHEWQDLALQIINELNVPSFKRNSVFKICKDKNKETVMRALNDTKELCKTGDKWKYFFKVVGL